MTDKVADSLRDQIVRNIYRPGEALLPEQKISEHYGVSRTVTREAISRLKAEGVVTVKQGVGVFVSSELAFKPFRIDSSIASNVDSVVDIIELRSGIEVKASELAAIRRKRSHLLEMNAALDEIDTAIEARDIAGNVEADLKFHSIIYGATGNPYYADFFVFISQYFRRVVARNRMYASSGDARHQGQREHREIFAAIVEQDVERTAAAARQHIENVAKRIHLAELNFLSIKSAVDLSEKLSKEIGRDREEI